MKTNTILFTYQGETYIRIYHHDMGWTEWYRLDIYLRAGAISSPKHDELEQAFQSYQNS